MKPVLALLGLILLSAPAQAGCGRDREDDLSSGDTLTVSVCATVESVKVVTAANCHEDPECIVSQEGEAPAPADYDETWKLVQQWRQQGGTDE